MFHIEARAVPVTRACHQCRHQYSATIAVRLWNVLDSNTEYLFSGCSLPVTVCALIQGNMTTNVTRFFILKGVVAKNICFSHTHFIGT